MFFAIEYSPAQLGTMLHKTLESYKKELNKPVSPSIKEIWMKESSLKMLDTLEMELKKFRKQHPNVKVTLDDILKTIGLSLDVFMDKVKIKKN